MLITRVRVYQDAQGGWRWTAYAGNNEAIAVSSESYVRQDYTVEQADALFPDATQTVEHNPDLNAAL